MAPKADLRPSQMRLASSSDLRFAQLHRVVAARDGLDQRQLLVDLGRAALDLDDQQRLAIGIAGLGKGLGQRGCRGGP
jgi:hypothetical protein